MYQNIYDQTKAQSNFQNAYPYKMEASDEFDEDIKYKKLKTTKDTGVNAKNGPGALLKLKSHLKNTYADKINNLMTETILNEDIIHNLENNVL